MKKKKREEEKIIKIFVLAPCEMQVARDAGVDLKHLKQNEEGNDPVIFSSNWSSSQSSQLARGFMQLCFHSNGLLSA